MGKNLKRLEAIAEIFNSEKSYIYDLRIWHYELRNEILKMDYIPGKRKYMICDIIFTNIEQIYALHCNIFFEMQIRNREVTSKYRKPGEERGDEDSFISDSILNFSNKVLYKRRLKEYTTDADSSIYLHREDSMSVSSITEEADSGDSTNVKKHTPHKNILCADFDIMKDGSMNTDTFEYATIFLKHLEDFSLYERYAADLPLSVYEFDKLMYTNPKFYESIKRFLLRYGMGDIGSKNFFYRPSSKIARYPLLFAAVLKYVDTPELKALYTELIEKLQVVNHRIDKIFKSRSVFHKTYAFSELVNFKSCPLFIGVMFKDIKLLLDGRLIVKRTSLEPASYKHVFIFSKFILICNAIKSEFDRVDINDMPIFLSRIVVVRRKFGLFGKSEELDGYSPLYLVHKNAKDIKALYFEDDGSRNIYYDLISKLIKKNKSKIIGNFEVEKFISLSEENITSVCMPVEEDYELVDQGIKYDFTYKGKHRKNVIDDETSSNTIKHNKEHNKDHMKNGKEHNKNGKEHKNNDKEYNKKQNKNNDKEHNKNNDKEYNKKYKKDNKNDVNSIISDYSSRCDKKSRVVSNSKIDSSSNSKIDSSSNSKINSTKNFRTNNESYINNKLKNIIKTDDYFMNKSENKYTNSTITSISKSNKKNSSKFQKKPKKIHSKKYKIFNFDQVSSESLDVSTASSIDWHNILSKDKDANEFIIGTDKDKKSELGIIHNLRNLDIMNLGNLSSEEDDNLSIENVGTFCFNCCANDDLFVLDMVFSKDVPEWTEEYEEIQKSIIIFSTKDGIYKKVKDNTTLISTRCARKIIYDDRNELLFYLCHNYLYISKFNHMTEILSDKKVDLEIANFFFGTLSNSTVVALTSRKIFGLSYIYLVNIDPTGKDLRVVYSKKLYVSFEIFYVVFVLNRIVISCKDFEVVEGDNLNTQELLEVYNPCMSILFGALKNLYARRIFKIEYDTYLLCYDGIGFFVDHQGRYKHIHIRFDWEDIGIEFRIYKRVIVCITKLYVNVFSLETGKLLYFKYFPGLRFVEGTLDIIFYGKDGLYRLIDIDFFNDNSHQENSNIKKKKHAKSKKANLPIMMQDTKPIQLINENESQKKISLITTDPNKNLPIKYFDKTAKINNIENEIIEYNSDDLCILSKSKKKFRKKRKCRNLLKSGFKFKLEVRLQKGLNLQDCIKHQIGNIIPGRINETEEESLSVFDIIDGYDV